MSWRRWVARAFPRAFKLALAQSCDAPPGTSAIDEYCESLPYAEGDRGPAARPPSDSALTPATTRALTAAGPEGEALSPSPARGRAGTRTHRAAGARGGQRHGHGEPAGLRDHLGRGRGRPSHAGPGCTRSPTPGVAKPSLDVIVVSYRCRELLSRCLASLAEHPARSAEMTVHVVDNASDDGTPAMVESEFPWVRLQALGENAGFSAANNLVLRSTDGPFALLLNPDTEVLEGALDHMLKTLDARPDAGLRAAGSSARRDLRPCRQARLPLLCRPSRISQVSAAALLPGGKLAQYRAPEVGEHDRARSTRSTGPSCRPARGRRPGGPPRRGLLALHGRSRLVLPVQASGLARLVRRLRQRRAREGRQRRRASPAAPEHRLPSGDGALLPQVLRSEHPLLAPVVYAGIGAKLAVSLARAATLRR